MTDQKLKPKCERKRVSWVANRREVLTSCTKRARRTLTPVRVEEENPRRLNFQPQQLCYAKVRPYNGNKIHDPWKGNI